MISYFVSYRKRPLIIAKQIGRCHQSFQYDFAANCSAGVRVSWKIGKVEKDEQENKKQEKY